MAQQSMNNCELYRLVSAKERNVERKKTVSKYDIVPALFTVKAKMTHCSEIAAILNFSSLKISTSVQSIHQGLRAGTFQPVAQPAEKEKARVDLYFKVKEKSHTKQITDQIINILTGEL